jgi:hypothetical protein
MIVLLTDGTWKTIRDAVQNTRDIVVNLEHGHRFRLKWEKTVYHNPIDGREYKAQWETCSPTTAPAPSNANVQLKETIFLVQPPREHVNIQELGAYINQVGEILKHSVPVTPIPLQGAKQVGRQIIVEIEMPKCQGWLKISAYPSMDGLDSQRILPQIAGLAQPRALSQVKFQLIFSLWGYQGQAARFS